MIRISNLRISPPYSDEKLDHAVRRKLSLAPEYPLHVKLTKRSIDARKRNEVLLICSADLELPKEQEYLNLPDITLVEPFSYVIKPSTQIPPHRPVIVGFGPAGMFAGLVLARAGLCPILLERGKSAEERTQDIEAAWNRGMLDPESNVQFGEGGAGTFSDGKLSTGIHDLRCRFVLEELVRHGAPSEILIQAKPHLGTDHLVRIVQSFRAEIEHLGGEVRFRHKLTDLLLEDQKLSGISVTDLSSDRPPYSLETQHLILAIGHSARDTFKMLSAHALPMERKAFSAGVRIEHLQKDINRIQYGHHAKWLPAADYKLAVHLPTGRGVYTFCMCPGGEVINASSEPGRLAVNGMSYYSRSGSNANSALLVSVAPEDFPSDDLLAGVEFQRTLEEAAFQLGGSNFCAPAQRLEDFLSRRPTTRFNKISPSYTPGTMPCDLGEILPPFIQNSIRDAVPLLDRKLRGFADPDAVLTGVETRSSSPIRILRTADGQSPVYGIYPCGEGCGYAGGIMSAAVDGVRCAEQLI